MVASHDREGSRVIAVEPQCELLVVELEELCFRVVQYREQQKSMAIPAEQESLSIGDHFVLAFDGARLFYINLRR